MSGEPTRSEPPFRLDGRTALVFGAGASGPGLSNGRAAALAYARSGARVVAVDIDPASAEATVAMIRDAGGEAIALAADVVRESDVADAVGVAVERYGTLDILHNNVGHVAMGGPPEITLEAFRREIDLNLTGAFLACRHAIPVMRRQARGVITNISSAAGLRYTGYPYASYYAAKGGLNQLTIGIALQYARDGIRANAILPGLMDTPLVYTQVAGDARTRAEVAAKRHEEAPTGRMGDAWDVAWAAVFLASEAGRYVNGVLLPVDGGWTARCS